MATEAQTAIGRLHAQGYSDTTIGHLVGRDSSLIHQGATGKKPLKNLVPALNRIAERGEPGSRYVKRLPPAARPETPPRRTTRTGQQARVRQPRATAVPREPKMRPPARIPSTTPREVRTASNGLPYMATGSKDGARFFASYTQALGPNYRLKVGYIGESGRMHIFGVHGGIAPSVVRELLASSSNIAEFLEALMEYLHYEGEEPALPARMFLFASRVDDYRLPAV